MMNSVWLALAVGAAATSAQPATIEYNRDVRPILAENCFACHGPDSASRKGDLRLDQRDAAIQAKAIVPGKPEDSVAIQRIRSTEEDEQMPPAASHKKLTAPQKDLLYRWIAAGAEYQPHWSLIAPVRPAAPKVKNTDWVRNPIDAFVLKKLEAVGLQPAPEADRRTLARRLSLDLRGLPPTLIAVGAIDGFSDEDIDYAVRLRHAGVPVELHVYPGAPHGFDALLPDLALSQRANRDIEDWLGARLT